MEAYVKIDSIAVSPDRTFTDVALRVRPRDEWGMTMGGQLAWGVHLQMVSDLDPEQPIRTIWERAEAAAKEWVTNPTPDGKPPDGFERSQRQGGLFPYRHPLHAR